jgi:hypothetical protein
MLFELQMSAQELFVKVANHLLNQGKRCIDSDSYCLYRSAEGLMCAAGCLIPNEVYHESFEGRDWLALIEKHDFPTQHKDLIISLQNVHDYRQNPEDWRTYLISLGKTHNLNTEFLKQ